MRCKPPGRVEDTASRQLQMHPVNEYFPISQNTKSKCQTSRTGLLDHRNPRFLKRNTKFSGLMESFFFTGHLIVWKEGYSVSQGLWISDHQSVCFPHPDS
ncbi:hypothetical protein GDO78_015423 [Eleutherodactylus coqui]|uniref:Uncharacterized protein n=1 Tax=Eleutherodactylus coqui TaxID=57060 RepID=A0A8J6EDM6_ELECQ|nr:hypothetical protein GDO78_015423 [Eleutherodactylus coqui]